MNHNDNPISDRTNALIEGLATQAGKRQAGGLNFGTVLPVALFVAVLAATAVVLLTVGPRADLMEILLTWTFQFKVIGMILIATGAFQLVRAVVRPGAAVHPVLGLVPGAVFLLGGAMFDRSSFPLLGIHTFSVLNCASIIILSSVPALAAILAAMRMGTPTRLARSGAIAGLLAGSIGALAYTIACLNDGAAFVALWYSVAIAVVALIGSLLGPKALAW